MATKRKLFSVTIKDCRVDTFTVGGHGGSGKDTSNTGVRILHLASGASGRAVESRSQFTNKETAFRRMAETPEFQRWARVEASRLMTAKTIDDIVLEELHPSKLRVEYRTEKGWEIVPAEVE